MNKQALISKIKKLDGVTQDERAYLINLVNTKKKYGLVWEDKPEDVEEQLRNNLPVLKEIKDKAIINGEDNPNHILIEGDNLHALTALTFTHEGAIDVIYIDPPYNTGNKDFKYNDTFVDKEDSYRHSKWLSFMDKRLRIAKRLLSDKGVIFISIDDNEQAQLKMLSDEIFQELNAIGPIIQNKQNAKNDSINIQKNHEYIFVYRKSCTYTENNKISPNLVNADYKKKVVFEEGGDYYYLNDSITTRGEGGILNARQNLGNTVYYNPVTKDIIAICDYDVELAKISNDEKSLYNNDSELILKGYTPIRPPKVRGKLGCWTWSKDKINEEKRYLIITGKKDAYSVKKRTFINHTEVYEENGKLFFNSFESGNSRSLVDFSTNDGTNALNEILDNGIFNNPKNLEMIKYFIKLIPNKRSTILDFFAGSGTTLHATMALNAEDGGNRQCILVTNNENNICEEVTYERNKRVIEGYTNAKDVAVAGLKNNNLRYFKADYVGRTKSLKNKKELTKLATELLCIKEDCYNPSPLTPESETKKVAVFDDHKTQLVVIYDDVFIGDSIEIIKKLKENQKTDSRIKVYVFCNGQYPYTEDFDEVADFVELCALPDAIYKAYQNVLPKTKRQIVPTLDDDETTDENLFNQSNS
ncbi:site-specific DNA-methyltransferase [Flavobacterium psychrophilum]|uniref:site-specific DNA-methyltransferase n=1 Tax=Flavobacterium psychrophilum TaxID=96345 RepID=UPI001D05D217|nr:site-specific DNA-methyltransferase [Flavobacterium psychrophilum]MCB6062424.1 site-specific DNA-methyltransferase [Flavobacterium psychrophilum]